MDARRALSLSPAGSKQRFMPLIREAQALEGLKKNRQALRSFKEALKIQPSNAALQRKIEYAQFRANAYKYGSVCQHSPPAACDWIVDAVDICVCGWIVDFLAVRYAGRGRAF